jgi:hypothetical protein
MARSGRSGRRQKEAKLAEKRRGRVKTPEEEREAVIKFVAEHPGATHAQLYAEFGHYTAVVAYGMAKRGLSPKARDRRPRNTTRRLDRPCSCSSKGAS